MQISLGQQIGRVRFVCGVKHAQVTPHSTDLNICSELSLVGADTKHSSSVVAPGLTLVLQIDGLRCRAQVFNPVVGFDAVDVVDALCRPCASCQEYSHAVRIGSVPEHGDADVSGLVWSPGFASSGVLRPSRHLPSELAGLRVIGKNIADLLGCWAHAIPRKKGRPCERAAPATAPEGTAETTYLMPRMIPCAKVVTVALADSALPAVVTVA